MGKRNLSYSNLKEEAAVDDKEYVGAFQEFLEEHNLHDIRTLLYAEDIQHHYSVHIEYAELLEDNPTLSNHLFLEPAKFLPLFDDAVRAVQARLQAEESSEDVSVKENIHVRLLVHGSALECSETRPSIGCIRVKDMGRLLTLKGTVIRSGSVKMLEGERYYECTRCKYRFKVAPQLETSNSLQLPTSCPSQRTQACSGASFVCLEDSTICHDYQEIKIQENMQSLGVGSVPRSIVIMLQDDLVDTIKAGDDVIVTGVLFSKWRPISKDVRCDLELMLHANYVRKANDLKMVMDVPEHIVEQFEQFWQHFESNPFKVALTLIGGVQHTDNSGTRIRGESHLLLVGDPGTGKSQFLKYAAKLSHRSVITTGLGSTSAGLTVTAIKDGGEWMLEAGALVLADGGLCCIDEFDSIREPDRATIHEAMEQQTISVAKAGLVTTLNTRTTVFGVTNPKGQYDPNQPLSVNTTLSGPLLSRFDIVLVLLDTKNPEWDKIVSAHILSEHSQKEASSCVSNLTGFWTLAMLRRYILYVKQKFRPVLTPEAEKVIISYYQLQRKSAVQNAARTTIRMLESLIRLAQAHARLMYRNQVTQADAVAAVVCVEASMTTSAILDNVGNALHSSFADNPDEEYSKQERLILANLNILHEPLDASCNVRGLEIPRSAELDSFPQAAFKAQTASVKSVHNEGDQPTSRPLLQPCDAAGREPLQARNLKNLKTPGPTSAAV